MQECVYCLIFTLLSTYITSLLPLHFSKRRKSMANSNPKYNMHTYIIAAVTEQLSWGFISHAHICHGCCKKGLFASERNLSPRHNGADADRCINIWSTSSLEIISSLKASQVVLWWEFTWWMETLMIDFSEWCELFQASMGHRRRLQLADRLHRCQRDGSSFLWIRGWEEHKINPWDYLESRSNLK